MSKRPNVLIVCGRNKRRSRTGNVIKLKNYRKKETGNTKSIYF